MIIIDNHAFIKEIITFNAYFKNNRFYNEKENVTRLQYALNNIEIKARNHAHSS